MPKLRSKGISQARWQCKILQHKKALPKHSVQWSSHVKGIQASPEQDILEVFFVPLDFCVLPEWRARFVQRALLPLVEPLEAAPHTTPPSTP